MPRRTATTSRRRWQAGERGSTTLELAVLMPLAMLLIFGIVQAGLWFYARGLVLAAAEEGARAAAAETGSSADGKSAAGSFLDRTGGTMVTHISITATRGTHATVTVTGNSLSLIPSWAGVITQSATLPVERLT